MDEWDKMKYIETHRLLKWIRNNLDVWQDICGLSGNELEPDTYAKYLEMLREERFYDLIIVFLSIHQEIHHVGEFMRDLALQKLDEEWDEGIGAKGFEYLLTESKKQMFSEQIGHNTTRENKRSSFTMKDIKIADKGDKPISKAYPVIDTDLARDNLENDLPASDLEDL